MNEREVKLKLKRPEQVERQHRTLAESMAIEAYDAYCCGLIDHDEYILILCDLCELEEE